MPEAKEPVCKYPAMWKSAKVFTGSRTEDPGESFYLEVDAAGIAAHRWSGMMDVFMYQTYWPKSVSRRIAHHGLMNFCETSEQNLNLANFDY